MTSEAERREVRTIGVVFALITLVGDGFQTIVNRLRPAAVSDLLFAWGAGTFEFLFLVLIWLAWQGLARKKCSEENDLNESSAQPKHKSISRAGMAARLAVSGTIFAVCAYLLIIGYSLVDSVVGILAVKTQPLSMLFIGALFLDEHLTRKEIAVGCGMLVLVYYVATVGTMSIDSVSPAVLLLLAIPVFWNIAHSIGKDLMNRGLISPVGYLVNRGAFTAVLLALVLLALGRAGEWALLAEPAVLQSLATMGALFTVLHICWYQAIKRLPLALASIIVVPSPVITALLAYLVTHEPIFAYHWVGIIGEILGLSLLLWLQRKA